MSYKRKEELEKIFGPGVKILQKKGYNNSMGMFNNFGDNWHKEEFPEQYGSLTNRIIHYILLTCKYFNELKYKLTNKNK